MKTAIRVLVYAGMLVAISANGQKFVGKTGQPVLFPIPPQMSQAVPQGAPLPFPIPPTSQERV